jgi:hypothetical protein
MTNRIGSCLGNVFEPLERASTTLGFCDAIARIHLQCCHCSTADFDDLARLEAEAVTIYRELGVPLPGE